MESIELSYKKPRAIKYLKKYQRDDEWLQSRINAVKRNLKVNFGYNDASASDVLEYVAGLLAKGE